MKKIPKKNIDNAFKCIELVEDIYYGYIKLIQTKHLHCFDKGYEFAIVEGEVIGIGYIDKNGKKKLIHHRR